MIITVQLDNVIASHDLTLKKLLNTDTLTVDNLSRAYSEGVLKTLPVEPDAAEILWKLNDQNHHIKILVSRFIQHGLNHKIVAHTTDWLDRYDIPYREIFFINTPVKLNTDVFIGDPLAPIDSKIIHIPYASLPGDKKWETIYEQLEAPFTLDAR